MDSRRLFEALVQENAQGLMIYLRSMLRDDHAVEEVFQETLITAWQVLDRFEQERSFGRWVRGIARNVVRKHWRQAAHPLVLTDESILDLVDARIESVQRMRNDLLDERLDRLRACIDTLPSRYRAAVDLRYQDDVRGLELAERLGTTWENTKKLLQRGRKLLHECMQRKWRGEASAEAAT